MKKRMLVHTVRPADSISIILPAAIRVYDQLENPTGDDFIAVWVLQERMLDARYELQECAENKIVCDYWMRNTCEDEYLDAVADASWADIEFKHALAEYLDARGKLLALL